MEMNALAYNNRIIDDKENKKKSRWGKKKKDEAKSADETSEGEASGKDVDAQDAASEEN